jgi:hypothetical protein
LTPTYPYSGLTSARKLTIPSVLYRLGVSGILALILLLGVANAAFADQVISYRVQDGDTLLSLASRFDVAADEVATVNGLTDPDILSVGQLLMFREPSAAYPFGLAVPDRRQDVVEEVQLALEPAAGSAGLVEDPPLAPSLLEMIATIGPVSALQRWTPAPIHPAIMPAPIYSQFDGSIWAPSNCGPAALSMALGALGIGADQITLRLLANAQMGSSDPNEGMSWEALAAAAQASGAGTKGLIGANGYRSWGIEDLKRELGLGHPVLLLLRYRLMPDHAASAYDGDHYVVALGFDQQGNLVYNDSAGNVAQGVRRRLTPAELDDAWTNTWVGQVRTAMAVYQ